LSPRRSLTKKAYDVDPPFCCGRIMRILAFIEQPEVTEKILTHLDI
jgi:hypothetical protein